MVLRPLIVQAALVLLAAAAGAAYSGVNGAIAALFGGSLILIRTIMLLGYYRRAVNSAGIDVGLNLRIAYRCSLERMAVTVLLLGLGLGILKLEPLALISAFVALQLAGLVGRFEESLLSNMHVKQ